MGRKITLLFTSIFTFVFTIGLCEIYQHYSDSSFVPSRSEMEFLGELKKDAGLQGDLVISVGPYHAFRVFMLGDNYLSTDIDIKMSLSAYSFSSGGAYYMMFDYEFYKRLTAKERKFVIAHEFWHIRRLIEANVNVKDLVFKDAIHEELRADILASKYVKPDIIIQFLNTYCEDKNQREMRIANIIQTLKN